MANYICTYRTNYFRVTDENRYKQLMLGVSSCDFCDFTKDLDGQIWHGFGDYDSMSYYLPASEIDGIKEMMKNNETFYDVNGEPIKYEAIDNEVQLYDKHGDIIFDRFDDCDGGFDWFIAELQKILNPADCFVYMESGFEKLRYVGGFVLVASKTEVRSSSIDSYINKTVKELLGENATTDYTY